MSSEPPDRPGILAPPPLVYAAGLGVGLSLEWIAPTGPFTSAYGRAIGAGLAGIGALIMGLGLRALRRAATPVNPYAATTALVTDGPFRWSRNPLYVALTLIYLGLASILDSLWSLAALPAVLVVMQRGVIAREERYLERKFQGAYLAYKARVRRWL